MIEIKPPAINGRTTEEKLNELIKYNEHLYDALSRKFENIDISDLNYTFAKKHEQYDEELAKLGRAKGGWDEKRICQDETGTDNKPLNHAQNPNANILKNCERIDDCEDAIEDVTDRLDTDEGDLDSLTKKITIYDTPLKTNYNDGYGDGKLHTYNDKDWANIEGIVKMIKRLYGNTYGETATSLSGANIISLAKSIREKANLTVHTTQTFTQKDSNGNTLYSYRYMKLNFGTFVAYLIKTIYLKCNTHYDLDIGQCNYEHSYIINSPSASDGSLEGNKYFRTQIISPTGDYRKYLRVSIDKPSGASMDGYDIDTLLVYYFYD